MLWTLIFLAAAFAVFGALRRVAPCNPGHAWFGREMGRDLVWWMLGFVLYGGLAATITRLLLRGLYGAEGQRLFATLEAGRGWLGGLPVLVQAGLIIFIVDVMQYWLHRAFHSRLLWPFHAVHHSAKQVEWTTTFRIHPVNYLLYDTLAGVVTLLLGCSPMAFVIVAPFNFFSAAFVHANLNWTFGPFRYLFASPVFHRWHHADDPAIYNKNFAPTFPFLDLMFGTFYMPKDRLPETYGAAGVPEDVLGQLAYPFTAVAAIISADRARARAPGRGAAARP